MEKIPDVVIRHSQTHRHKPGKGYVVSSTSASTPVSASFSGRRSLCQRSFRRLADRGQKDRALALGVRVEELRDFVVVERQSGGSQPQGVRGEVHLAAQDSCLELSGAIAAIAERAEPAYEVAEKEHHGRGVAREPLFQRQVGGVSAEVA